MANRAKYANDANHARQLEYLKHGIVMLPKEETGRRKRGHRRKGSRRS